MLEKGSEYQALQLAETEPVLLDLIATLSFAEAPDWVAYCAANQLPTPPKFDAKSVQALDRVYAKGISANHPLYKEYRAAVSSRDDARAIQIIRSIVRLNPDDANANAEQARIANKLFQLKLQELRGALGERDEKVILSALSELEGLGTPARLAEAPEYARAMVTRCEVAKREAMAVAGRWVEALDGERQAGAWRMVGDLLARVRALQDEHGFALTDEQTARCAEMQQYFEEQRSAAQETARFEQALATLGGVAQGFDARLLTRSTLTVAEAESLHAAFNRRWQEIEQFQRPVPEVFIQRVRTSVSALRAELDRLRRQRRLKMLLSGAAILTFLAVAAWFTITAWRAQEYATQLAGLRDAGQVEAAEKMTSEVRRDHGALAAQPKLSARLSEVENWTGAERTKLADIESRLGELEALAKAGLEEAEPMTLWTKVETTGQLIEVLAKGLQASPAGRLLVVRNEFESHLTVLREKLIGQAAGELSALENQAGEKLAYDQPKEVLTQAVAELEPGLKSLEMRVKPALAALELPAAQAARVGALRKRVDLFHAELDALAGVKQSLLQAATLDDFLKALGEYKASRLSQAREVSEARKLLGALPKTDDLLASLLMPGDPVGWAAAKADAAGVALTPDTVLPAEIGRLVALRDDNNLNEIWQIAFTDYHKKSARRDLYARGDLRKGGPSEVGAVQTTTWTGDIYDPAAKPEVFMPNTTKTMQKSGFGAAGDGEVTASHLSAESEFLTRLELNRMTDSTGSRFERPLLRAFDDLVREKTVNVIFRAYLMQQLGAVLKVRPYAWGLEHCGSLRHDLDELDKLCEGNPLRSMDWLLERKRTQLDPRLTAFFGRLQSRAYLWEARLHRELVREVIKAGLQYGGFVDAAGEAHLLGEAHSGKALWVLAGDRKTLVRYLPASVPKSADPPQTGFSPVFLVPLDGQALLAEAERKLPGQAPGKMRLTGMPWMDTP